MTAPLATIEDLKKRWKDMPLEDQEDAEQHLIDASLEIRGAFPDIDRRIATQEINQEVVVMVVCRMVKRAMKPVEATNEAPQNATQLSFTAGAFNQQFTLRPNDGAIYMSRADKKLLAPSTASSEQVFGFIPR